jgi:hypothetical protein
MIAIYHLKILILSWLLHHANRLGRNEYFYTIKNQILKRYGKHQGYDVQFIEGKKCHSCDGTGIYEWEDWEDNTWTAEPCYKCHNGWFKRPTWNILARVNFGNHTFHQPYQRVYEAPTISNPIIEGYIDHIKSRYSYFAATILFLIYEKGYLKRWYKESGTGWFLSWWLPKNIPSNIVHLIKHGRRSLPIRKVQQKIHERIMHIKNKLKIAKRKINTNFSEDDLPF